MSVYGTVRGGRGRVTALTVRRMGWEFDATVPFQWNPANPQFAMGMNFLSFVAPAFERFVVSSVRAAMEVIDDPAALAEADAFLRQEALHARAHRAHTSALVEKYPGLKQVLVEFDRRFDEMEASSSLAYQLAYTADIEATFTPFFNLILRHRGTFFEGGDDRVASLLLWHFSEEIEHRSSAQIVYDAVVPSPWFRLRVAPSVFGHLFGCLNHFFRAVDEIVPFEDRGMDAADMVFDRSLPRRALARDKPQLPPHFGGVPRREIAVMVARLVRSQAPGHSPADEVTPPFADAWFAAYEAGEDVRHWYGSVEQAHRAPLGPGGTTNRPTGSTT